MKNSSLPCTGGVLSIKRFIFLITKDTQHRMGFPRFICSFILFFTVLGDTSFSQIIFKELPGYQSDFSDSVFFGLGLAEFVVFFYFLFDVPGAV